MEGILNSPRGHALASRTAWEGLWSAQTAELTIRRDAAVEMHHAIECGPTCDPVIFVSLDSLAIDNSRPKGIEIGRISSPVLIPIFCASFIITYRHYDDLSIQNRTVTFRSARWTRDFPSAGMLARHLRKKLGAVESVAGSANDRAATRAFGISVIGFMQFGVGGPERRASALCGTRPNQQLQHAQPLRVGPAGIG
jgi:hypothetical protein